MANTPLNTRHYMALVMGAISSVLTAVTGSTDHSIPTLLQYAQVNLIPGLILAADWIAARIKEWRGVSGYESFMVALRTAVNAAPELKAALDKIGLKLPA